MRVARLRARQPGFLSGGSTWPVFEAILPCFGTNPASPAQPPGHPRGSGMLMFWCERPGPHPPPSAIAASSQPTTRFSRATFRMPRWCPACWCCRRFWMPPRSGWAPRCTRCACVRPSSRPPGCRAWQVQASLERDGPQLRFEVTADDQTLALGVFELESRRPWDFSEKVSWRCCCRRHRAVAQQPPHGARIWMPCCTTWRDRRRPPRPLWRSISRPCSAGPLIVSGRTAVRRPGLPGAHRG